MWTMWDLALSFPALSSSRCIVPSRWWEHGTMSREGVGAERRSKNGLRDLWGSRIIEARRKCDEE